MRLRRLLTCAAVVGVTLASTVMTTAAPAAASPFSSDCKELISIQRPDEGFSGWIDSGPDNPSNDTIYERYVRVPPWHTYDTAQSHAGVCVDTEYGAHFDTMIGNWLMGGATVIVGALSTLHRWIATPTFLSSLDPLMQRATDAIGGGIVLEWLGVSLLILGIVLISLARHKDLPRSLHAAGWAIAMLTIAAFCLSYPIRAGHLADKPSVAVVDQINASLLGQTAGAAPSTTDPGSARSSMVTQTVEYGPWCRGELGSDTSALAKEYCPKLLEAQAFPKSDLLYWTDYEANAAIAQFAQAGGHVDGGITDLKRLQELAQRWPNEASCAHLGGCYDFQKLAAEIKSKDPAAYDNLRGTGHSRIGEGAIALGTALAIGPFMVVADLLVIVGFIVWRLAVIAAPAVALVALHGRYSRYMVAIMKMAVAGILNLVVFAAAGGIFTLAAGYLLSPSSGMPLLEELLVTAVLWVLIWKITRPLRRFSAVLPIEGMQERGGWMGRKVGGYLSSYLGSRAGARDAPKDNPGPADEDTLPDPARHEQDEDGRYRWAAASRAEAPSSESRPLSTGPPRGRIPIDLADTAPDEATRGALPPGPEILVRGNPGPTRYADQVIDEDGRPIHRIYRPATDGFIPAPDERASPSESLSQDADPVAASISVPASPADVHPAGDP